MSDPSAKTRQFFEEMYSKELTDDEVREYKDRIVKFFGLLVEIDMKNKKKGR